MFIDDDAGAGNEFHNNNIYNNRDDGMEEQAGYSVDATCNWWGNVSGPSGPGSGDGVSGNVLFAPWLLSPTPGGTCYPFATFDSIIASCAESTKNHGQFVGCVSRKTNKLLRDGDITEKDAAAIIRWVALGYIP